MKSFDDIVNDKINEGLADKWKNKNGMSPTEDSVIGLMLIDIMEKLDEIENLLHTDVIGIGA